MTRLLRLPDVLAQIGLKRSTLYAEIAAGRFPAQIRIGRRCVAWDADAVDQWVQDRIAAHGRAKGKIKAPDES